MCCEGGIGEDLPKLKAQSTSCNYTQIRKAISLYTQTHVISHTCHTCRHISPCPHAWCFALSVLVLMLGVFLWALQHSLHGSACSCAWLASIYIHAQTHLPCPARHSGIIVAPYTCTHAFALPNMAHVQTPLASCCLNAVEQSLHLRRTYMYIAHASIHAVYIHIFMHICRFHIFMLAFMLGACVARPWIYS